MINEMENKELIWRINKPERLLRLITYGEIDQEK